MATISVNFDKTIGKIKPMHAINNAPLLGATDELFHYLKEAGIPYSRLHDTGGAYGNNRFVDIENIFRNWDADETDPNSYDFAFTDWLLEALVKQDVEPFFRLGASIENQHNIKAYRIYPPKDNLKWAKICEHIIAHYNEGWADGYHFGIKYWEIWNEPECFPDIKDNSMWQGTFEEYIELYKVTAKHLKDRFGDTIKVGGYASCGFYAITNRFNAEAKSSPRTEYFVDSFHQFMAEIAKDNIPLDFFSWHSYSVKMDNVIYARYAREQLDKYGYTDTESNLDEWNAGTHLRGTLLDSANISAELLTLQNEPLDMMMYYDGQVHGDYQGLFNPIKKEPFKAYYTLKAFDKLYRLGESVEVTFDNSDIYCLAAKSQSEKAIMVTNLGEATELSIKAAGKYDIYRLNDEVSLELCETDVEIDDIKIGQYETLLIVSK